MKLSQVFRIAEHQVPGALKYERASGVFDEHNLINMPELMEHACLSRRAAAHLAGSTAPGSAPSGILVTVQEAVPEERAE